MILSTIVLWPTHDLAKVTINQICIIPILPNLKLILPTYTLWHNDNIQSGFFGLNVCVRLKTLVSLVFLHTRMKHMSMW